VVVAHPQKVFWVMHSTEPSPISSTIQRIEILGVPVDALKAGQAIDYVRHQILEGHGPTTILAINPEKVMTLRKSPSLLSFFRDAGLLLPDGIGVVLAGRLLYGNAIARIPGADFMMDICALAEREGFRIFLFGSSEETSSKAESYLQRRFPALKIAGRSNGYILAGGMDSLIEAINNSGASILFIALGSPRQEQWLREHMGKLQVKICQGIGGTLDTLAGNVRRAPLLFQTLGLEWFYRLCAEPRRIKRQIVIPVFSCLVLWQRMSGKKT
jgi:N-acetylglucosaminyldiphosphoundecaprenol N-acetyl-beta-D-mannosaminyltransferase